ncbi:beta-amylase 2, chloroplastic-like [Andrographis paniculata]|uniref:beta-amylase 2, chloroplastic-like n=1 Tax=Andrographis paniculata TaxID=175694 RepID=UPI0021E73971|nr:beta-amylase 2, chloroplastic-like [Andrographis paniculata]
METVTASLEMLRSFALRTPASSTRSTPFPFQCSTVSPRCRRTTTESKMLRTAFLNRGVDFRANSRRTDLMERNFEGDNYIPVYVMLPLGVINERGELVDYTSLENQLFQLKRMGVDGVMVDCWWGLVEGRSPQQYNWRAYNELFQLVRNTGLKLQVVLSFHECGGNVGDDVNIPLPEWVSQIGNANHDIFFTDRDGRRNHECLTWGIDTERVLMNRTAIEVYFDFMRSFRVEFDEYLANGTITAVEIGLGPCGELRYPSYPSKYGWKYPGIGEFQCHDRYLMMSLKEAAEERGHSFWGVPPANAGDYNSYPYETSFFGDGGQYDSSYGRFFLDWYSQTLIDHGDRVLSFAKLVFDCTPIAAKVSGIHWWYKTANHAAELTAGLYNPSNRNGYTAIVEMLKKHGAILNFTCAELRTQDQANECPQALSDPEGLVWQVLNTAWEKGVNVACENALWCFSKERYEKILQNARPANDPDRRKIYSFTYLRLCPQLLENHNSEDFCDFVKRMHG